MAAKHSLGGTALHFIAWITGVIVSLVVGYGMINGTLTLPSWLGGTSGVGVLVTMVVGWIVVIATLISAVLAVIRR